MKKNAVSNSNYFKYIILKIVLIISPKKKKTNLKGKFFGTPYTFRMFKINARTTQTFYLWQIFKNSISNLFFIFDFQLRGVEEVNSEKFWVVEIFKNWKHLTHSSNMFHEISMFNVILLMFRVTCALSAECF